MTRSDTRAMTMLGLDRPSHDLAAGASAAAPAPMLALGPKQAVVAIIDDEPINIKVTQKYLQRSGYEHFVTSTDAAKAFELIQAERPDVLLLDLMMPEVGGLDILRLMQGDPQARLIPVIILTASNDRASKHEALALGATDFLAKPLDVDEMIPRVRNALMIKAHHDHMARYAHDLQREVASRTSELAHSRIDVVHRLARAAEFRDNETGQHVIRVGRYSQIIAEALGLDETTVDLIAHASPLHDVGKIGIPDAILLKPGKLTPEEFEVMQSHSTLGKNIFSRITDSEWVSFQSHTDVGARILGGSDCPLIQMASRIAISHHEKWDGTGYPLALAGEDIPLEGRIVAVADVFDALSSKRPYKPAFALKKCFEIMEEGRDKHFDPRVLDVFFAQREKIVAIQVQHADLA